MRIGRTTGCASRSSLLFELRLAFVNRTQLVRKLVRKLGEPLLARVDELELSLGERDRCVDDPRTLVVICTLGPLIAQGGARLYGFGELDELVECQPQQVAE